MMERFTIANDRYAREIGFDYGAAAASDTQAALLNGFAEGLHGGADSMQGYYIVHDLTPTARRMVKDLAAGIGDADD